MPIIQEFAQAIVEKYDYSQSAWVTVNTLDDDKIVSAGIRKQCCPDGAITIGGVYAALLNITCRMPGMSYFQVRSSRITMKHKYAGELDYTQLGVFYVTDCNRIAGDLFQITAQDAVGWTDMSAYCADDSSDGSIPTKYGVGAFVKADQDQNGHSTVQGEISRVIRITNTFINARSGIPNLLEYEGYNESANYYYHCNQVVPNTTGTVYPDGPYKLDVYDIKNHEYVHSAFFPLYSSGGYEGLQSCARSDSPRDFLKLLAEIACGFIYAKENGKLTLGQFGQTEFGWFDPDTSPGRNPEGIDTTQIITKSDVEDGSWEIANYDIEILKCECIFEKSGSSSVNKMWAGGDYDKHAYIRYRIEENPYMNGFYNNYGGSYDTGFLNRGVWNHLKEYGGGYTIMPFRATVHKTMRFHLGQRIKLVGFSTNDLLSIVTSIQWMFRGGWKIACGGEDGRSMIDSIRATKGDKVERDLRNSIQALRDQS